MLCLFYYLSSPASGLRSFHSFLSSTSYRFAFVYFLTLLLILSSAFYSSCLLSFYTYSPHSLYCLPVFPHLPLVFCVARLSPNRVAYSSFSHFLDLLFSSYGSSSTYSYLLLYFLRSLFLLPPFLCTFAIFLTGPILFSF